MATPNELVPELLEAGVHFGQDEATKYLRLGENCFLWPRLGHRVGSRAFAEWGERDELGCGPSVVSIF